MVVAFNELLGKTLTEVNLCNETITFTCSDGCNYRLYRQREGSESISIKKIVGTFKTLLNTPLNYAAECSEEDLTVGKGKFHGTYCLGTIKGSVTILWSGSIEGYHGEKVIFDRVNRPSNDTENGRLLEGSVLHTYQEQKIAEKSFERPRESSPNEFNGIYSVPREEGLERGSSEAVRATLGGFRGHPRKIPGGFRGHPRKTSEGCRNRMR